jgi:nitroimidazol reductase NimA-like FMN-containing flavoprotein (pyridoxamine 5'-phosphate oxidase superfamily)
MSSDKTQVFEKTALNNVRLATRAHYDIATILAIGAECKVAHVAWTDELTGLPNCIPMLAAIEEINGYLFVYFHG